MADFSTLIATLQATIKTNYNQEITGQILQDDLLAIVDAVNRLKQDTLEGYAFYGAPLADGDSVSVTQNTFFLVAEGEYEINGSTIEVDAAGVSVIVYDSVNDTTNWYTLFAYDTTPTENSRNAITSGAVAAALAPLATKEDVEAVEQEVAQIAGEAGLAEAVIDTDGAGTEQEFTFRKSGGDGGAYYRKIKGKTLAWNQLGRALNTSGTYAGITLVADADGSFSVSGTAQETQHFDFYDSRNDGNIIGDHKYYISCGLSGGSNETYCIYDRGYFAYISDGRGVILTGAGNIFVPAFKVYAGVSVDFKVYPQFIDLTLLYGTEIDGLTDEQILAKYEADFGTGYHPFAQKLISNDAEAVETTGRNQYNPATGKAQVIGGQTYYIGGTYTSLSQDGAVITPAGDGTFTPASTGEVDVVGGNATDTIINISDADNGLWQPFWKRTLQLGITTRKDTDGNVPFPNGLQSCPVAQDEATKEGGTIRVGTRAYQAGDESDADVITDGTNTNYALATPVPFTWAEPLNLGVKVDENGTERAVAPEGATAPSAPFVADTTYTMSVARMVEKLRNL